MEHPELLDKNVLDRSFANWVSKVNSQLADIARLEGRKRDAFCTRAQVPRFVVQCILGQPGSSGKKYSPVIVAWKTIAAWLSDFMWLPGLVECTGFSWRALGIIWARAYRCSTSLGAQSKGS